MCGGLLKCAYEAAPHAAKPTSHAPPSLAMPPPRGQRGSHFKHYLSPSACLVGLGGHNKPVLSTLRDRSWNPVVFQCARGKNHPLTWS